MFCPTCSKLAAIPQMRKCLRCSGDIEYNLSVICSKCSDEEKVCEACLKKIGISPPRSRGCASCGKGGL